MLLPPSLLVKQLLLALVVMVLMLLPPLMNSYSIFPLAPGKIVPMLAAHALFLSTSLLVDSMPQYLQAGQLTSMKRPTMLCRFRSSVMLTPLTPWTTPWLLLATTTAMLPTIATMVLNRLAQLLLVG